MLYENLLPGDILLQKKPVITDPTETFNTGKLITLYRRSPLSLHPLEEKTDLYYRTRSMMPDVALTRKKYEENFTFYLRPDRNVKKGDLCRLTIINCTGPCIDELVEVIETNEQTTTIRSVTTGTISSLLSKEIQERLYKISGDALETYIRHQISDRLTKQDELNLQIKNLLNVKKQDSPD